jgi:hypothetical protein
MVRPLNMSARRFLCLLGLCFGLAAGVCPAQDDLLSLGPLYQEFRLTLEPGHRTEALGPFFYYERLEDSKLWAVPPVFSYESSSSIDYGRFEFAWKALTYRRYGDEFRLQLLQLFNVAGGGTQTETNVHRFTLFPVFFRQWSDMPEKNYWALVPIHGTIRDRLFRDEVKFTLFPLYGQTRKRDVVTANYLYPIFHRRHGDGLTGWQVWPLAGAEHKDFTGKTNAWGDVELVGGHDKVFALWPLFFRQRTGLGTTNWARAETLIPFYSYQHSPARSSESFLWPFGLTHIIEREKKYEEWQLAYPLVVFAHGQGKTVRRVWPFFSQAHNARQTSAWYAWPVYKYNAFQSDTFQRERTRLLLFLYSDTRATNKELAASQRQVDLWPLFTARRDFEGKRRLQVLSLVEPILPNNRGVENNLSPLWSLWRAEQNPKTGASSQSLLWNLYRRDATPAVKKCSLLFGLVQYQSRPEGRRWRLFFIPLGGRKAGDLAPAP